MSRVMVWIAFMAYCANCGKFTDHTDTPTCKECGR